MFMFKSVMDPNFVQIENKEPYLFRVWIERGSWFKEFIFLEGILNRDVLINIPQLFQVINFLIFPSMPTSKPP